MVRYAATWIALLCLTTLTLVMSNVELGTASIAIALLIAATKVSLVLLFFMHLYDQRNANRIVFSVAVVFIVVLILLVAADVSYRQDPPFRPPIA